MGEDDNSQPLVSVNPRSSLAGVRREVQRHLLGPELDGARSQGPQDLFSVFESTGESPRISPRDQGFELPVFVHILPQARDKIATFAYTDLSTVLPEDGCAFENEEWVMKGNPGRPEGITWGPKKNYKKIRFFVNLASGIWNLFCSSPQIPSRNGCPDQAV